ncbi:uncharacterized protein [Henckelia pumila]|uniref:uncharacterized protein n=1 Tax=Henckelia pumila TaxID=405737 RepID=UPI003C6E4019
MSVDKIKTEKSVPNYETLIDDGMKVLSKDEYLQGKPVALTLVSKTNVVAYGTIVDVNGAGKLLHGVPLPMNCMRVSVDEAVEKSALLPFPIPNECDTVGDAIGTHVSCPAHLVVMKDEKPQRKKIVEKKSNPVLPSNVPRSLHILYCYDKRGLKIPGKHISMFLDHDLFDDEYELLVDLEDITPFYLLEPISANCIVVYMWILFKKMKKDNKVKKFRFMNPHTISVMPYVSKLDENEKIEHLNSWASVLVDRLSGAARNQLVLVPYNVGCHWILTVIDPYVEVVYLLDSLSHRNRYEDWKYGPRQPDAKQCGYYLMRFMKEIVEENAASDKDSLSSIFMKTVYSNEEIDEVRSEWAECVCKTLCFVLFLTPISVVPLVALVVFGLYELGFPKVTRE